MADFLLAKLSASSGLSKQIVCSSSVSRKAFSRESTVDSTDAMACSEVLRAAPANHRALCSGGRRLISTWKQLLPLVWDGSSRSCTSLNTDTMWRRFPKLPINFLGRQVLSQQEDHRCEQTLGGVVEKCVLAVAAAVPVRADDGLGEDLGVLFRLGPCRKVVGMLHRLIHVGVRQRQKIEPV